MSARSTEIEMATKSQSIDKYVGNRLASKSAPLGARILEGKRLPYKQNNPENKNARARRGFLLRREILLLLLAFVVGFALKHRELS